MSATTPALTPVSGLGFAETRASGPTLEIARRRWWLLVIPIAAIAAAGAVYFTTRTDTRPPVSQTPAAPPPSAPAVAKKPEHVIVDVAGAPEGTQVLIGGIKKGFTPKVQLDYSDQPVILDFEADGFQPAQATITPDHAQSIDVTMKPRPVPPTPAPTKPRPHPAKHDRDSLEAPKEFGK